MHLTDEQLNEYLDNETMEGALIEAHLSSCGECVARLTALQALFEEIESLPELELTHSLAARFTLTSKLFPQFPRWLTLTAILQAAFAVITIIFSAPYVASSIEPYSQLFALPTLTDVWLDIQLGFTAWIQSLGSISLPEIPSNVFTLPSEITPGILALSVMGMFVIWMFGNWWLLRRKTNPLA